MKGYFSGADDEAADLVNQKLYHNGFDHNLVG